MLDTNLAEPWSDILSLSGDGDVHLDWRNASILDLGCGVSFDVLRLFERTGFARYKGVERKRRDSRTINYLSLYNNYSSLRLEGLLQGPDLNERLFKKRISVRYSINVEHFLPPHKEYDIIVLSNLLHLDGPKRVWKDLLRAASNCLRPDGYLYIRVFIRPNEYGSYFNDVELAEMENMLLEPKKTFVDKNEKVRLFGRAAPQLK